MLSVVLAIARQTASATPGEFIERFSERIQALAASQDLLVQNKWKGVDLNELVQSQLAHFTDLIGTRIELQGRNCETGLASGEGNSSRTFQPTFSDCINSYGR